MTQCILCSEGIAIHAVIEGVTIACKVQKSASIVTYCDGEVEVLTILCKSLWHLRCRCILSDAVIVGLILISQGVAQRREGGLTILTRDGNGLCLTILLRRSLLSLTIHLCQGKGEFLIL